MRQHDNIESNMLMVGQSVIYVKLFCNFIISLYMYAIIGWSQPAEVPSKPYYHILKVLKRDIRLCRETTVKTRDVSRK